MSFYVKFHKTRLQADSALFFYIKFQIASCLKLLHNNAIIKLKTAAAAVIYAFTDSVDNI